MPRIPQAPNANTSPEALADLEDLFAQWGERWGVVGSIANSPNLLKIFTAINTQMKKSSLSEDDREVIDLFLAKVNGCHYCVPAHTLVARSIGMDDAEIRVILEGGTPKDPRRALILKALKAINETKGGLSDNAYQGFIKDGLTDENLLDIIGEIAHCTITNYTNRLAQTDLDDFLVDVKPVITPEGMPTPSKTKYPLRAPKVG